MVIGLLAPISSACSDDAVSQAPAEPKSIVQSDMSAPDPISNPAPPDSSTDQNTEENSEEAIQEPYSERVTLETDTPDVSITEVHVFDEPMEVIGLGTNQVTYVEVGDDHGIECETFGMIFTLSNAAIVSPKLDICDGWKATIPTGWPSYDAAALQAEPDLTWMVFRQEAEGTDGFPSHHLSYGIPETDAILAYAQCVEESNFATFNFQMGVQRSEQQEPSEQNVRLDMIVGDTLFKFDGGWSDAQSEEAPSVPNVFLHISHPIWNAITESSTLDISINNGNMSRMDLQTNRNAIVKFIDGCSYEPNQTVEGDASQ